MNTVRRTCTREHNRDGQGMQAYIAEEAVRCVMIVLSEPYRALRRLHCGREGRYTDTARALRGTRGNDSGIQAHDQHLAMEMQAGRFTEVCAHRLYTTVSLVQASKSGLMTTGLEMMMSTLC